MKNIIRSMTYELKKTKAIRVTFIVGLLFVLLEGFLNIDPSSDNMPQNTSQLVADNGSSNILIFVFVASILVGYICSGDFRDKVINYEILSGHSRKQVFISRFIPGVLLVAFLITILQFSMMIPGAILYGWGDAVSLKDVIIRTLLAFFPAVRFSAFIVVIAFIVKSQNIMIGVGYALFEFCGIVEQFGIGKNSYANSIYNWKLLFDFKGVPAKGVDAADAVVKYTSYTSTVHGQMVLWTILISLIMTAIYMFVGYSLFRRDDLS